MVSTAAVASEDFWTCSTVSVSGGLHNLQPCGSYCIPSAMIGSHGTGRRSPRFLVSPGIIGGQGATLGYRLVVKQACRLASPRMHGRERCFASSQPVMATSASPSNDLLP
jgi:hypothetical protein